MRDVAAGLHYRDFITVGVLVKKLRPNRGCLAGHPANLLPDTWIYIQEPDVKLGRLQIFNNWSPAMVRDPDTIWLGLEYFCQEDDELWRLSDEDMGRFAVAELATIDLIDAADALDFNVVRVPKAYPAYFGTYDQFDVLPRHTDTITNLFLVGRNGMHRYNNQDHSMLTARLAVEAILAGSSSKDEIWNINVDDEYHTYGTVADWLFDRCYETLTTELVLEWDPDRALDRSVNENASFSGALLYLGHLSTVSSEYGACGHFLDKGALQAALFKGLLPFEDKCTCEDFPQGVLQLLPNNSYTWYHSGWYIEDHNCPDGCVFPYFYSSTPALDKYTQYIEDLSHAVTTLILPRMADQIDLSTAGNVPFDDVDMVRFRNTFTKNLWSAADEDFYNTTAGTLSRFWDNDGPDQAMGWHKYKSLAWMPLC